MRHSIAVVISALALMGAVPAGGQQPGAACAISAFVTDRDPGGLNVRAGPSTTARVVQLVSNAGSGVAQIRGHQGGWLRVTALTDAEDQTALFRGDGWVHGSLLGLEIANADPRLYAGPSRRSRVIATLRAASSEATLIGCSGGWAQVRVEGRVGWLSPGGQCSSPRTTCA